MFTADGAYSIEYRSTDRAGNVEAIKTVAFTIGTPTGDTTAPVTTADAGPGAARSRPDLPGPVGVRLSALDPARPRTSTSTPTARCGRRRPSASTPATASRGASARARAAPMTSGSSRRAATRARAAAGADQGLGHRLPGRHAGLADAHADGHVDVRLPPARGVHRRRLDRHDRHATVAAGGGSGVGATEYRVDGGDWVRNANSGGASPFATAFTVSAEGQHTVEYRSTDNAGNVEATKTVAFGIEAPEPGFPVIEAFADPRSGSAPLLVRYTATGFDPDGGRLSYRWEFENGTMFGGGGHAHVHAARHLHGDADRDRRRGRQGDQGGRRHRHRARRRAADGAGRARTLGGPAPLPVRFSATGDDPDGPTRTTALPLGVRRRRHSFASATRATPTCRRAPTRPR